MVTNLAKFNTSNNILKMSQEAFNRPYKLAVPENAHLRHASVMNTKKKLVVA